MEIIQSHLANLSLVTIIQGRKKSNYRKVKVVGVNQDQSIPSNRWFSRRNDEGYLYYKSLLPVEDYLFLMTNKAPEVGFGETSNELMGTLWQLVSDDSFYSLECENMPKDRVYYIFRVFSLANQAAPIAYVGVAPEETKVFENIESLTENHAIGMFDKIKEMEKIRDAFSFWKINSEQNANSEVNELIEDEVAKIKEIDQTQESRNSVTPENSIPHIDKQIICTSDRSIKVNIRSEDLNKVLFKAQLGEEVRVFQTWDAKARIHKIRGEQYEFVQVQFKNREEEDQLVGWVAKSLVQLASDCTAYSDNIFVRDHNIEISSVEDKECCEFPLEARPTHPYNSGMRKFGARRGGGTRAHAGCDLYRYENEPVLAIAPGKVIYGLYYFYQGTYALEVEFPGGYIVRYGEITGKSPTGVRRGAKVKMGDQLGYIGKLNSNCCRPMLHFELFDGTAKGALTQRSNGKFQRRSDLVDPTELLLRWEENKF